MSRIQSISPFILSAMMLASAAPALASPLGTAFTYQGQITEAGSAMNAAADFEFRLFDSQSAGNLVAGPVSVSDVEVIEGLFTVTVDFGAPAFNGDARWLEIAVRSPAGSGTFTTLSTRQSLTAAPYARFATAAPWTGLAGIPAGFADGIDNGSGDGHSLDAADGSPADVVFVNSIGRVGVGTTNPLTKLYVDEASNASAVISIDSGTSSPFQSALDFRDRGALKWGMGKGFNNEFYLDDTTAGGRRLTIPAGSGMVGISTTNPVGGLHINREPLTNGGTLALEGTTHTYISFFPDGVAAGRKGYLGFPAAAFSDIHLTNEIPAGNIVLVPGAGGAVSVPILQISGADLAERFPTSDSVEPGMLVAIDPTNPGKLCLASDAYNRAVAGIVSGANDFSAGAVLGHLPGHEDAPPVALSGRVYVWCEASNGAIAPGDLLTTSDTPGHAMKATDRDRSYGAVIGKAMTGLDSGRGLVLVLVSLQ